MYLPYKRNRKKLSIWFSAILIKPTQGGIEFFCTFVYGFNEFNSRSSLWEGIKEIATKVAGGWVLMGDFNAFSSVDDRIGSSVRMTEVRPMLDCMNVCGLSDVKANGRYYTWSNKQEGSARVFSRIDRVLANTVWLDSYDQAAVSFLPEGNFDHSPALLSVYAVPEIHRPLKFCNVWIQYPAMMEVVKEAWRNPVQGCPMYIH